MTQPSDKLIANTRKASERMADRRTPFIFNEWYVAFMEDVEGLGALEKVLDDIEGDEQTYEISVASDAPAVAMRMYLKQRALAEAR